MMSQNSDQSPTPSSRKKPSSLYHWFFGTLKRRILVSVIVVLTILIVLPFYRPSRPSIDFRTLINKPRGPEIPAEENFYAGLLPLLPPMEGEDGKTLAKLAEVIHAPALKPESPRFDLSFFQDPATQYTDAFRDELKRLRSQLWSVDDFPELALAIVSNSRALDELQKVVMRPKAWRPYISDAEMLPLNDETRPELKVLHQLPDLYLLRATLQFPEKNAAESLPDILTVFRLGRQIAQQPSIDEMEAVYVMESRAISVASVWMMSPGMTSEQRNELLREVRALKPAIPAATVLDHGERNMARFSLYTANVPGPLRKIAKRITMLPSSDEDNPLEKLMLDSMLAFDFKIADKRQQECFDTVVKIAGDPPSPSRVQAMDDLKEVISQSQDKTRSRNLILNLMSSRQKGVAIGDQAALSGLAATKLALLYQDRPAIRRELLASAVACANLRDEKGHWPQTLAELPEDVAAVKDPYSDKPYRLAETDDGFQIYSLGPDGKDHLVDEPDRFSTHDDVIVTLKQSVVNKDASFVPVAPSVP